MDGTIYDFHTCQRDTNFVTFIEPATQISVTVPMAWDDVFWVARNAKNLSDRTIPYTPRWRW